MVELSKKYVLLSEQERDHSDEYEADGEEEAEPLEQSPFIQPTIGRQQWMVSQWADKTRPYCPSRKVLIMLTILTTLLYYLSTLQTSFVINRRPSWMGLNQLANLSNGSMQRSPEGTMQILYNLLAQVNERLSFERKTKESEISLPRRIQLNDTQAFVLAERESNVAAKYFEQWALNFASSGARMSRHESVIYCEKVQLPSPTRIKHNNLYWQVTQTVFNHTPMTVYLFNAYYDTRLYGKPEVKMITATDRQSDVEKKKWWCLLWFEGEKSPVLANVTEVFSIWPEYWGYGASPEIFGPQFVSCRIPEEYSLHMPAAISLVDTDDCAQMPSQPSNVLRVINNQPEPKFHKPSIGICVQAFRFGTYDMSVRLVEWLEWVRMMGADQVYFYVYSATENMLKVLLHYEKEGLVNWRRLTLPGFQANIESLYNFYYTRMQAKFWPQELLELNDCLYRNIHRHQYLGVFDIDEVIMPQTFNNWHELIAKIESGFSPAEQKRKAYLMNRHSYIYEMFEETDIATEEGTESIPEYLYTMRHTYRSELFPSGYNIKCLHRTDLVTALHNHFPMRCINTTGHQSCNGHKVDPKDSILMHYRRDRDPPKNCKTPQDPKQCAVHDQTAWRYFHTLKANVSRQLRDIFGEK